jgi:hypothetical protein
VGSGAGRLTDADTELIWLAFGNPTQNTGAFRECFGKHRNLWRTAQIDAREVEGVNTQYLDELVAAYGADSDVVRVRVRGQFPSSSTMQFIPQDLAEAARRGRCRGIAHRSGDLRRRLCPLWR